MSEGSEPGPGPGRRLEVGPYVLNAATDFGPRIIEFRQGGSPALFARLSEDVVLEHPDSGTYRFRGGHRLWAAPEVPSVSYAPDDRPCSLSTGAGTFTLTGTADRAGLVKTIEVHQVDDGLVVDHSLSKPEGPELELAAWAITQLRLGGVALLPIDPRSPGGPRASASIVVWPYTDPTDSRLQWHRNGIAVRAEPGPPFKIGVGPDPGRIGYLIEDYLFIKEVPDGSRHRQPDRGAVAEVYVNEAFVELESLGPLTPVRGDRTASQRELWRIRPCPDIGRAWELLLGEPVS